jgi:hypothetical protein
VKVLKDGILRIVKVCGYNLLEPDIVKIFEGLSSYFFGRGTMGIYVFYRERADHFLIGTGASKKDGLVEAEWLKRYLINNLDGIFTEFPVFRELDIYLKKAKKTLNGIIHTDKESKNTKEEMEKTIQYALGLRTKYELFGYNNIPIIIYIVSCPAHLPRVVRDMNLTLEEMNLLNIKTKIQVYYIASHVPYTYKRVEIIEN